ncbi:hypothetical protein [Nostoc sp.]|uniref:hypothetical protein n=1 Tax=Nostoc sp. TaxID=1180 RepID=UPI002FFA9CE6
MTLDDSLPFLYETLRVACFSVRVAFRRKGVRYRRRTPVLSPSNGTISLGFSLRGLFD